MPDGEAAAFFFHDQAANNDAPHAQIDEQHTLRAEDMPGLPPETFKALVVGQQAVAKGRQGSDALNKVQVGPAGRGWAQACGVLGPSCSVTCPVSPLPQTLSTYCLVPFTVLKVILCVVRLPQHGSDILLTCNSPIFISEHSAAVEHAGKLMPPWRAWLRSDAEPLPSCLIVGACASTHRLMSAASCAAGAGYKGAHLTAPALFRRILATFQINDWGLLGG